MNDSGDLNVLNDWNGLNETVQLVQKVQAVIEKTPEVSRE